jgi:hypothetical protein
VNLTINATVHSQNPVVKNLAIFARASPIAVNVINLN